MVNNYRWIVRDKRGRSIMRYWITRSNHTLMTGNIYLPILDPCHATGFGYPVISQPSLFFVITRRFFNMLVSIIYPS